MLIDGMSIQDAVNLRRAKVAGNRWVIKEDMVWYRYYSNNLLLYKSLGAVYEACRDIIQKGADRIL